VLLEIRARLSLEVAKFKANAKAAGASFKVIASASKISADKIDAYTKRNLNNKLKALEQVKRAEQRALGFSSMEKGKVTAGPQKQLQDKSNKTTIAGAEVTARKSAAAQLREYKKGAAQRKALEQRTSVSIAAAQVKEHKKAVSAKTAADKNAAAKSKIAAARAANLRTQVGPRALVRSKEFESEAPRIRYAMYDIGRRALVAGAAIAGVGVAAVAMAAKFESAFTAVERTSGLAGVQLENLRQQLIEISTTIPVAFEEVAAIATLGAQMGIASDSLDEFTTTVARFSAITGITAEQTAQSFGRLAQLMGVPVSKFENLSSAITYAGIRAVATDAEILKMSESIAAAASNSGFAADEIIGYATALSSLKVRAEEARGVMVRTFRNIDLAVSQGGEKLQDFAKVLGMTSEESRSLWTQDPSRFFATFLEGANATGKLNEVMTDLGIVNVRELNVIQRLAGNMEVLTAALGDTREQYLLGTYASEAYAKKADDLASKLQVMMQTVQAFIASVGGPLAEALKPFIDIITGVLNTVKNVPAAFSTIIILITSLVGGFLLFKAATALSIAGLLALKTAMTGLTGQLGGLNISMKSAFILAKNMGMSLKFAGINAGTAGIGFARTGMALTNMGFSARAATVAMRGLTIATGPIGMALALIATVLPSVITAFGKTDDAAQKAGASMFDAAGGAEALIKAIAQDTDEAQGSFREVTIGVNALTEAEIEAKKATYESAIARAKAIAEITGNKEELEELVEIQTKFNAEIAAGNSGLATNTALLGDNTAAAILNGLSKYNNAGDDFFAQMTELSPGAKTALEAFGFSAGEMVAAGLKKDGGAEEYADNFQAIIDTIALSDPKNIDQIQKTLGLLGFDKTKEELVGLLAAFKGSGNELRGFAANAVDASRATDGTIQVSIRAAEAADLKAQAFEDAGVAAEGDEAATESLGDALRRYAKSAGQVQGNTVDLYDSFADLAGVFGYTTGELDILTQEGRDAMSAWSDFMQDAIDNAVANDTNFIGSISTMAAAIFAMGQEGINTGYQFQTMKEYIIRNLLATVPSLEVFRGKISEAMDTEGVIEMIDAQIALAQTIMGNKGVTGVDITEDKKNIAYLISLRNGLADSGGAASNFSGVFRDAMDEVEDSAGKAVSALEQLKNLIESAFKYTDIFSSMYDSLNKLGDSLQKNGKDFSIYSEEGRSNIDALQDTIDVLAEKSGGNVTKFANDLASLRKALVEAGAPAAALKIIDSVTKQIGKTGKASAHNVNQFAEALESAGDNLRPLQKIKDLMDEIASGVRDGFDAIYAQAGALDSVTLGWLDMADAADSARESIASAGEDIDDARLEIVKLKAEIEDLAADKGKLEYQLSIALKYGDTIRANEIRADLANLAADVLSKEDAISDANKGISESSEKIAEANGVLGNAPSLRQQIERNQALRDMALRYGDVAASLIASAEPGTNLNDIINKQVTAFEQSAIEMGYSKTEASAMAGVLRDELIYQMDQIPEDIETDIKAETSVATTAVDNFVTFANARLAQIKDKTVTVNTVHTSSSAGNFKGFVPGGGSGGNMIRRASGGYVSGPGSSSSDSIAAMLSNGEYVVRASAVSKYGVDFLNSLNQMKTAPSRASSAVSQQSGGSGMVYLSPEDRQLLRAAIDRPISLYTDNTVIASSANKGNQILAQRGIK
jgi:TP901 family phage tail tape measure protein